MNLALKIFLICLLLWSCNNHGDSAEPEVQAQEALDSLVVNNVPKDSLSPDSILSYHEGQYLLPPFKLVGYAVVNSSLNQDFLSQFKGFQKKLPIFLKHYQKKLPNVSKYECYYLSLSCQSEVERDSLCPDSPLSFGLLMLYNPAYQQAIVVTAEYHYSLNSETHSMSFSIQEDSVIYLTEYIQKADQQDSTIVAEHRVAISPEGYFHPTHQYHYIQKGVPTGIIDTVPSSKTALADSAVEGTGEPTEFPLPPINYLKYLHTDTYLSQDYPQSPFIEKRLKDYLTVYHKRLPNISIYESYFLSVDCCEGCANTSMCPDGYIEPLGFENSIGLLILYEPISQAAYVLNVTYYFYGDSGHAMHYSLSKDDKIYLQEETSSEDDEMDDHVEGQTIEILPDGTIKTE